MGVMDLWGFDVSVSRHIQAYMYKGAVGLSILVSKFIVALDTLRVLTAHVYESTRSIGYLFYGSSSGWSGGAMVLGKFPVPGRPTIWIIVGQGPTTLAVGAGGGCLDIFILIYPFFPLSPSLWETARYRLKYCLKGPLIPIQPTNQLWEL